MGHFTKNQILEIERALSDRAIRDSELARVDALSDSDLVPVVQNGTNKTIEYQHMVSDISNKKHVVLSESEYEELKNRGELNPEVFYYTYEDEEEA